MAKRRSYTISDGKLVLTLTESADGGFIVTNPLDPELVTQAETLAEAFANARDLQKLLAEHRNAARRSQKRRPVAKAGGAV